jgi:SAM-dependent methyltransferase
MPRSSVGAAWEPRLIAEADRLLGLRGKHNPESAARDLLALQRGLTGERGLIGSSYMDERRRLASYLLFYWPVSYAQTRAMLRMARVSGSGGAVRILDLGSGPAPCSIAAADHIGAAGAAIVACDRSPAALESAERLASSSGYRLEAVPRWDAAASAVPDGRFDLIVVGHLLNELWADLDDRIDRRFSLLSAALSRLNPEGSLLFLEPATLAAGREAIVLRDRLAASGRRILAPCLRSGRCPALETEGQTCHSDFSWETPPVVRDLSQRTGLGKDLVKTTAFVVAADLADNRGTPQPESELSEYRVVSDPMVNKAGRVRYLLCGPDGRFPFSAKRGEGFPAEKMFFSMKRSDRIAVRGAVRRETGLALGPETAIDRS